MMIKKQHSNEAIAAIGRVARNSDTRGSRKGIIEIIAELKFLQKKDFLTVSGISLLEFEKKVLAVFKMMLSLNLGDLDSWRVELGNKCFNDAAPRLDLIAWWESNNLSIKIVADLINDKNYFYLSNSSESSSTEDFEEFKGAILHELL